MNFFDNSSFVSVHKALEATALRQQVISNNIANATTPGFKKSSVEFESYLRDVLNQRNSITGVRTDARHIPIGIDKSLQSIAPKVVRHQDTSINNNDNNVDIVAEEANLARNQILFDALSQNMNGKFQKLRMVIGGR